MVTARFKQFAATYGETQVCTENQLIEKLKAQIPLFDPVGWFMAEALDMCSSRCGERIILPYGPNCTHKTPPSGLFSPRGLASDTSKVIDTIERKELDTHNSDGCN